MLVNRERTARRDCVHLLICLAVPVIRHTCVDEWEYIYYSDYVIGSVNQKNSKSFPTGISDDTRSTCWCMSGNQTPELFTWILTQNNKYWINSYANILRPQNWLQYTRKALLLVQWTGIIFRHQLECFTGHANYSFFRLYSYFPLKLHIFPFLLR